MRRLAQSGAVRRHPTARGVALAASRGDSAGPGDRATPTGGRWDLGRATHMATRYRQSVSHTAVTAPGSSYEYVLTNKAVIGSSFVYLCDTQTRTTRYII
jgi:hypothetical protein